MKSPQCLHLSPARKSRCDRDGGGGGVCAHTHTRTHTHTTHTRHTNQMLFARRTAKPPPQFCSYLPSACHSCLESNDTGTSHTHTQVYTHRDPSHTLKCTHTKAPRLQRDYSWRSNKH